MRLNRYLKYYAFAVMCRSFLMSMLIAFQNGTYIQNPSYPSWLTTAGRFRYQFIPSEFNSDTICSIRLDFESVVLAQPMDDGCDNVDRIEVETGSRQRVPTVCGFLTGSHSK